MEGGKGIKNSRGKASRKINSWLSSYWPCRPGFFPSIKFDKVTGKEKQQLMKGEIRKGEEEDRMGKIVGLRQSGAWTKWESTVNKKIK